MTKYEVTFNRNVKYGADTYRAGEKATVSAEDIEALTEVINEDYVEIVTEENEVKQIEDFTVAELKAYATEKEIDLGAAKKRDELLEAVLAYEAKTKE